MRTGRATLSAILGTVAILSPAASTPAAAQSQNSPSGVTLPGVPLSAFTVRMGAIEAQTPDARQERTTSRSRGGPRVLHVATVDDETPWILPSPAPPDEFETTGVLQCVPYARFLSGIALRGDAWTWWDKAAGIYARGNHPEPGAVLSFPGTERMPLGHVAVVTQVLSERKILIDHANWPNAFVEHGAISRDIQVVDVSSANDWTEVRVQFGEGGPLGTVYAANGFIYGWTETGVRIAQPRFSLDYALWSPVAPSWRMFNSIAYLWALPPAERKKAYAAAGVVPNPASPGRGRPVLVLGPIGPGVDAGGLEQPLGVNRLDVKAGGRAGFGVGRFVMQ
jgi:surface antigen